MRVEKSVSLFVVGLGRLTYRKTNMGEKILDHSKP
jgi:hypothetical protein